jgi:hypothetical protein
MHGGFAQYSACKQGIPVHGIIIINIYKNPILYSYSFYNITTDPTEISIQP